MLELIAAKIKFLLIAALVFAAADALAADKPKVPAKEKRVYLQFENQLVQGENDKPGGDLIFNRNQATFKKLIKIREDFIPEVKGGKGDFGGE
jgi:hypothetical protein